MPLPFLAALVSSEAALPRLPLNALGPLRSSSTIEPKESVLLRFFGYWFPDSISLFALVCLVTSHSPVSSPSLPSALPPHVPLVSCRCFLSNSKIHKLSYIYRCLAHGRDFSISRTVLACLTCSVLSFLCAFRCPWHNGERLFVL